MFCDLYIWGANVARAIKTFILKFWKEETCCNEGCDWVYHYSQDYEMPQYQYQIIIGSRDITEHAVMMQLHCQSQDITKRNERGILSQS